MALLSKETLIGAGALGAGAVIAKVVHKKVLPMTKVALFEEKVIGVTSVASNLATLAVGIFTPMIVKGAPGSVVNSIGKGLGAGMIAVSVAGLVTPLLETAGVTLTGYSSDDYMGNVMMGEVDASNGVLMGAVEDIFTAPTQDYSADASGEANF